LTDKFTDRVSNPALIAYIHFMKCYAVKRKHRKRKILLIVLLILIAVTVGAVIFIRSNVTPVIIAISNERIKNLTTDAVSAAVLDVMSENTDAEYIKVTRDTESNITGVETDVDTINSLAQRITVLAQKNINAIGSDGISVPLGSLSGVTLFTGMGPDIKIKIYLVGSTQTRITSVFTDTGVNQTLHRLFFNIDSSVAVAVPGLPSAIDISTQVLMSEMIIVGDVPQTYLKSMSVGDMLDLAA